MTQREWDAHVFSKPVLCAKGPGKGAISASRCTWASRATGTCAQQIDVQILLQAIKGAFSRSQTRAGGLPANRCERCTQGCARRPAVPVCESGIVAHVVCKRAHGGHAPFRCPAAPAAAGAGGSPLESGPPIAVHLSTACRSSLSAVAQQQRHVAQQHPAKQRDAMTMAPAAGGPTVAASVLSCTQLPLCNSALLPIVQLQASHAAAGACCSSQNLCT